MVVPLRILLTVTLLASFGAAQDPLPLAERAFIAGKVYGATLQYFAHWQDVPDLNPDAAYRKYVDAALAAADRRAFSRATMEFLASFRNSHTTVIDQALIQSKGRLPFSARYLEGKWIVTESWTKGLQAGHLIESIDGEAFETFFARHRRFISASTEAWARRALFAQMPSFAPYAHLLPDRFVLGLNGGRTAEVDRIASGAAALPPTEGRWLDPEKVAYIRIPCFFTPEYEKKALELLAGFRSAAALIVDVRGNTGGSTPGQLTSQLMDRPYRWWTESTPMSLPYFRLRAAQGSGELQPFARPDILWRSNPQKPGNEPFAGRLVLLIDAACHSACEDFVMPFKDNGRATIVGETTAGSTGQPYMFEPIKDMLVIIGAKREMFPDGSQFESVGIKPDVAAGPSLEDIRQGRDAVLEAARKALSRIN